jgi:O-antigen/teichoic acid export membrane protein
MAAHAEKNTKILIRPSAIGAGISVVLLPRLLSLWGINGMGIALLCAGIAVVLSLHYALIKQKYIQLPSRDIAKAFGAGLMLLSCDYVLSPWLSGIQYATGLQFFWVVIFCLFVAYDWLKKLFLTPVSQSVMIN